MTGGPVDAVVRLPGSKSLTNRALLLAATASGPGVVRRALRSRDTELMAAALRALGHQVDTTGEDWTVAPRTVAGGSPSVDCGLAGTVMRFVPPIAALGRAVVAFDGDPHMRTRPVGTLLGALADLGVEVDGGPTLPFTVVGHGAVAGGRVVLDASASSQFVSALLLAGASYDAGVDVVHDGKPVPSLPHLEMTLALLRGQGVAAAGPDDLGEPDRWRVAPGPVAPVDLEIEPDLSNAAPFLALAAVTGGRVLVPGWPARTTQPGDRLRELLGSMGCTVELADDGLLVVGPEELEGIDVDLRDVGELTPVVAALCAVAGSPSVLRGVGHIRGHETDRLAALAAELGRLGADVTEREDGLALRPARLHGGLFRTYADHRMAHAAAVVGAVVPGVEIEDVATTAKTFPGFADAWSAAAER